MSRRSQARFAAFALVALMLAACGAPVSSTPRTDSSTNAQATPTARGTDIPPVRVQIPGSGSLGIFDPAPVKDPNSDRIWMSYSSVEPSSWPANKRISTKIAHSDDRGATWKDDGVVNASTDITLPLAAPNNAGTWQEEVSRLAYDRFAPAKERWILIWMRYLEVNGVRHFDHAWIDMRTASSPTGPWTSPKKLFVGAGYPSSDDSIEGKPLVRLTALSDDLAACVAATEPGVMAQQEALYVSLYCAAADPAAGRQILLSLSRATGQWSYAGSFTTNEDAREMGYDDFSATELVDQGDRHYLVVSPEKDGKYKGCLVFQIGDLAKAELVGSDGRPALVRKIELSVGGQSFGGACGYAQGLVTGILYSELFGEVPPFRIFGTNVHL